MSWTWQTRDRQKVDFQVVVYKNLQQMRDIIKNLLSNCQNVIMEISEDGMLAGCNYLDYGTGLWLIL